MKTLTIKELYFSLPEKTRNLWSDWENFRATIIVARNKGLIETSTEGRTVMYPESIIRSNE